MSNRKQISENVKRKLYAESMGRCMNPECYCKLFEGEGDIVEKAHIVAHCETSDNSFENLVILCPNCHTRFDKNHSFTLETVKQWKSIRNNEVEKIFSIKYSSFEELKCAVFPLLSENKAIYENYYLNENKKLWEKFETVILINNRKLKKILVNNLNLIQTHSKKQYSNADLVQTFIMHIDEFEVSRLCDEKSRQVLFPEEINSIFGVAPVKRNLLPMTETLEELIGKLHEQGVFKSVVMGIDDPYIEIKDAEETNKIYLRDVPRLRQLYFDYKCFTRVKVRLESLNFALSYIRTRKLTYKFLKYDNLREIEINGTKFIFVYEYCLSKVFLMELSPDENCVIVNLHNWNRECCISKEAHNFSKTINVRLLTMDDFYGYINEFKNKK